MVLVQCNQKSAFTGRTACLHKRGPGGKAMEYLAF